MNNKTTAFYAETISITIFSLVAASLWIELTKNTVARLFKNHPLALLLSALSTTFIAIFGLKYLFCTSITHVPRNDKTI